MASPLATAAPRPRRIAYAVTSALTADHLLRGQLRFLPSRGYEVTLLCAPHPSLEAIGAREGIEIVPVAMRRAIAPLTDVVSLIAMLRALRRLRPDCVTASTPKAALLALVAARLLRVPIRVYTLRGLRLETVRGIRRRLLTLTERLTAACATDVVCVSPSLRRRYLELALAPEAKTRVLGAGSSNGIDCRRFEAARRGESSLALRRELGLAESDRVIGFVGRLTADKGIVDLLNAWDRLRASGVQARLLVIGDLEDGDPIPPTAAQRLAHDADLIHRRWSADIERYYPLMDVLALPSYREGLPNAPLEAACAGVPTVGYRSTGTVDAIEDGTTGTLAEVGDVDGLAAALTAYLENRQLARDHGAAAQRRAVELFSRERVWEALAADYRDLFSRQGIPCHAAPDPGAKEMGTR